MKLEGKGFTTRPFGLKSVQLIIYSRSALFEKSLWNASISSILLFFFSDGVRVLRLFGEQCLRYSTLAQIQCQHVVAMNTLSQKAIEKKKKSNMILQYANEITGRAEKEGHDRNI